MLNNEIQDGVLYSCISGNDNSEEPGFIEFNGDDITYYSIVGELKILHTKKIKSKIPTDLEGFQYWGFSLDHTHNFREIFI